MKQIVISLSLLFSLAGTCAKAEITSTNLHEVLRNTAHNLRALNLELDKLEKTASNVLISTETPLYSLSRFCVFLGRLDERASRFPDIFYSNMYPLKFDGMEDIQEIYNQAREQSMVKMDALMDAADSITSICFSENGDRQQDIESIAERAFFIQKTAAQIRDLIWDTSRLISLKANPILTLVPNR